MPATVEKLPNEPIVIVTIIGQLNVDMMRAVYQQIADILETIAPPLYRITDARLQETEFADMMAIIKEASQGQRGTTTDPRVRNVLVGRHKHSLLARDSYANVDPNRQVMPVFETIEDALIYIRHEIGKQQEELPEENNPE